MSWFNDLIGATPARVERVNTDQYSQMGSQFMDPNSSLNRGMYNQLKRMGIDSAAQQYLSGMRMQAAGQNPFANEQYQSGLSNNLGQTQNAYNQYMQGAQQTGSGLFGYALQGNMQNAQSQNAANMSAQQNKNQFLGGLFGSAIGALPSFLFPTGGA